MKRRNSGAIRRPSNRRRAPDGFLKSAFDWRTMLLIPQQQILLSGERETPIGRRWFELVDGEWREPE
jgi:hypothetical protein